MDDLDHSIHIAEFDWTSFCNESEECCLLQASLACLDSLSLSDAEEPEHQVVERQEDEQSDGAGSGAAEESGVKLLVKPHEGGEDSVAQVDTLGTTELHEETVEGVAEETGGVRNTEQTDPECSAVSEEQREEEGDDSRDEPDALSCTQTGVNVTDPPGADVAADEGASSVAPRAEKERWFVTVNDSPARLRAKANSVKKKRRQKKACKDSQSHGEGARSHLKVQTQRCESGGGRGEGGLVQTNQDTGAQRSGGQTTNPEGSTDSGEEDADATVTSRPPEVNTTEPVEEDAGGSVSASHHTHTPTHTHGPESVESEEAEDAIEFFSSHSFDSENYLSAAESLEETRPVAVMQLQRPAPLFEGDTHMCSRCESTDCLTAGDGIRRRADAEPALTFPSAGQRAEKMPDDDSACDDNTHLLTHTPGLQEDKVTIRASGGPPDSSLTPDNPEAYAKATGRAQPVYAISAFWDEMEKLTINDILQLKMGKSTPPWETQEMGTASRDDSPVSHGALTHVAQDGGLMDGSDAADSDYFTQADESKPDRSSCEFSTSDFEEEYWQFIGASRNPSPDPHFKNLQRTNDSPFSSQEEEEEAESASSEGKETPVPLEDFEGEGFEDQEIQTLTKAAWPTRKTKSTHNVQALLNEDLTSPFTNDISSVLLSSTEESMVLEVSDPLETFIPEAFLPNTHILDEHYQISFPEVFEYFFTEDKAKMDSGCVALYRPEDISVTPVFDYPLCTFRDELSFFSLHESQCREEEPIPIFSCPRPMLTFPPPNHVFLSADYTVEDDMDSLSPIRVVSRAFLQADRHGATSSGGPRSWSSFLSMRKIRFHNKGSIWCRRSGAWVFPVQAGRTERQDPPVGVLTQGRGSWDASQMFRELALQQSILGDVQTTRREGVFSTLKQADMCLVCIAFASWVLRSSDPEAADTWKAALLANVSALSAIQYLRHYVKRRTPDR